MALWLWLVMQSDLREGILDISSKLVSLRPSDVLRGETHLLAEAAGETDDDHLSCGHTESGD